MADNKSAHTTISKQFSRRDVLRTSTIVGAGLATAALSACGPGENTAEAPATPAPTPEAVATPPAETPMPPQSDAMSATKSTFEAWTKIPVPEQVEAFEGYADTDPVKLWYWDTGGEGEVIVLNHPWSQSSLCWPYQQPALSAAGYRVIAWSRRGAYKTEVGPLDNVSTSAEDQKKLLDFLEIDKCHMVGCAAGGVTSMNFALENPDRLYSLLLGGSVLLPDEDDYKAIRARIGLPQGHNTTAAFREVGPGYRGAHPEGVKAWSALEHLAYPSDPWHDQPWGSEPVTWARMEQLQVPVLLFTGDSDHSAPATMKRLFAQHLPNRELAVIREAGHAAYWEQPEAFNGLVLNFIGRHGA